MSQARGFAGIPRSGHCSSAAAKASCRASSAKSKSPRRRISVAKTRPASRRSTTSTFAAEATSPRSGPDRTHFDAALLGARDACGDRQRFVQVLRLDEIVAAELLTRLGERPIGDDDLAVAHA